MAVSLLLLAWLTAASQVVESQVGEISGTAVNGSAGDVPVAGTEVVLRASQDGAFVPVESTTTDAQGRFSFKDLPVDQGMIYLPGVNRLGIHYPGPRVRLTPHQSSSRVKLVAFDTVESPSPLICRRHQISARPAEGFLEVTEELVIDNPSRTTFVGQRVGDQGPVTLRLSLPSGIENVTFDREFHGRNFELKEEQLTTDLPWPPGSRELKFIYRVPVERRYGILTRVLDQPTDHIVIQIAANDASSVLCNLPKASSETGQLTVFEQRGTALPAGFEVTLQLGAVPLRFEAYARWLALAVLIVLIAGSVLITRGWARSGPGKQERVPQPTLRRIDSHGRPTGKRRRFASSPPNQ
jgi:hypothetical protein